MPPSDPVTLPPLEVGWIVVVEVEVEFVVVVLEVELVVVDEVVNDIVDVDELEVVERDVVDVELEVNEVVGIVETLVVVFIVVVVGNEVEIEVGVVVVELTVVVVLANVHTQLFHQLFECADIVPKERNKVITVAKILKVFLIFPLLLLLL